MEITKIESQKHRQNRYSIYIDGEFAIGVNEEVLLSLELRQGMEVPASLLEKIINAEKKRKVKEQALNLLSYRARSKKELTDRLQQKGAEIQCIDEVLANLESIGLVNDIEFAKLWVRERGKLYGPFRLKSELFKKGVDREIIEKALNEFNELELAQNIAQRWLNSHKSLSNEVIKRRLIGFLARRGISYNTINSLDIFTEI